MHRSSLEMPRVVRTNYLLAFEQTMPLAISNLLTISAFHFQHPRCAMPHYMVMEKIDIFSFQEYFLRRPHVAYTRQGFNVSQLTKCLCGCLVHHILPTNMRFLLQHPYSHPLIPHSSLLPQHRPSPNLSSFCSLAIHASENHLSTAAIFNQSDTSTSTRII